MQHTKLYYVPFLELLLANKFIYLFIHLICLSIISFILSHSI